MCGGRVTYGAKRRNTHKVWCPIANLKSSEVVDRRECTCEVERIGDTLHMQCARAL
jgi:hypothetical protein